MQDSICHVCTGIYKMFAIIENDQKFFFAQVVTQHVNEWTLRFFTQTDGNRCRPGHKPRVQNWSELDKPRAIGILIEHFTCNLDRKARLAGSTRTDQCEQVRVLQKYLCVCQFFFPPNETS